MERITITITNWQKWNPRKDYRKPTWFAMSNDLLDHPDFADFTPHEFHALVYIFSQASKRNSPTIDIVPMHARQRNITDDILQTTLNKLEKIQALAVTRTESVQNPTESVLYRETERETGNTGITAVASPRARKRQELFKPETVEELRAAFDADTRKAWAELYPDAEYRKRESLKAWEWYREAGAKRPTTLRGWKQALSSWFARGWSGHVTGIPRDSIRARAGQGPPPIRYPDANVVIAEEAAQRGEDKRGDPESMAKVRALLNQAGNLGVKKAEGA